MSVGTRNPTATDATLQTSAASSARAEENKKHLASAVYPKPFDIIVFAVWFGVLVGLLEVACLAARIFIRGRTVGQPVDVIWMAPVADAGLFLQIGAGGALLAWRFTRLLSLRTTVMAFAAVGVFCVLLHAPSLHIYAALLLAIGIGWQTGQLIASDPRRLIAMVHGSTAWARLRCSGKKACIGSATDEELTCRLNRRQVLIGSSATVAGLMAGVATWRTVTTRRAISALPAAVTGAPNVLLIVLDTVRAESLSLYGYDRPTSRALERLAQTGVRFLRAFSCAPWTLPSHASMFTGRFPHELSADWIKPLDSRYPTLAEALGASGYETAGFVANTKYCGRHTGLHRGFVHYEDFPVSPIQVLRASAFGAKLDDKIRLATGYEELPGRKSAGELNTDFLNWLRN